MDPLTILAGLKTGLAAGKTVENTMEYLTRRPMNSDGR